MTKIKKYDLFCDFDSTAVNSTKRLVEILNEKFNKNCKWNEITKYDAKDLFPEANREDIISAFASKDFFNDLEIFDGFINVMKKYQNNFNYHIATIGTKDNIRNKKIWCADNFDFVYEFKEIIKDGMGKSEIDMSGGILIDDHIDNLRTSNATIKILYKGGVETDWNTIDENSDVDKVFWQADSWEDVDDILKFILKINLLEE